MRFSVFTNYNFSLSVTANLSRIVNHARAGLSEVTAPNLAIARANVLVATYRLSPQGVAERARFIRREGQ
jgi:hypothetical protein